MALDAVLVLHVVARGRHRGAYREEEQRAAPRPPLDVRRGRDGGAYGQHAVMASAKRTPVKILTSSTMLAQHLSYPCLPI